jgi:hypothetical protein
MNKCEIEIKITIPLREILNAKIEEDMKLELQALSQQRESILKKQERKKLWREYWEAFCEWLNNKHEKRMSMVRKRISQRKYINARDAYLCVIPRFTFNPYNNDNETRYTEYRKKYKIQRDEDDDETLKQAREYDAHPMFDVIKIGLKEHKPSFILNHKSHPRNLERYAEHCEKFNIEPSEYIMTLCENNDNMWEKNIKESLKLLEKRKVQK